MSGIMDWMTGKDIGNTPAKTSPSIEARKKIVFGKKDGVDYVVVEGPFFDESEGKTVEKVYLGLNLVGRDPDNDVDIDIEPDEEAVRQGKSYARHVHVKLGVSKAEHWKKKGIVFVENTLELREVDTYIPLPFLVCCGADVHSEAKFDSSLGGMCLIELQRYNKGSKIKFS